MTMVYFVFQQTMFFTIPLLIVALGGLFSERSGIINIALEGIMTMGALGGILYINLMQKDMSGQLLLLTALVVSGVAGGLFSLLHAYASIHMKADQTISGTALNMLAPALSIFVARMIFGVQQINFQNTFRLEAVPFFERIPILGKFLFCNAYLTTYIGLFIFIISTVVLYRTAFGLRLRACGEHPQAAESAGINVYGMRYAGVVISGVLGGMGGLILVIPTSTNFNATVGGYGFLALAVLIFGQWRPSRILISACFFGIMKAISATYSGIPWLSNLGISNTIYKVIPYVCTLIVLAVSSKYSMAPKVEGLPYDKGQR